MKKKLVLIEDDIQLRENLAEILGNEFEVIHASDGKTGVKIIQRELPDIVVSDILMPGFSGHEIKKTLNSDPLLSTIPFIFLTAKANKSDIRKGMDLGADDYLTKPFTKEELLNSIHSRLKKNEILKKHTKELTKSIAFSLPHELNNPLVSILGYSEIILDLAESREHTAYTEIASAAELIHSSGRDLLGMLKRFLLVVKLQMIFSDINEIKKYNDNKTETINTLILGLTIENILDSYDTNRFTFSEPSEIMNLDISHEDLSIVLKEIIDNAVKFSTSDSEISVSVGSNSDYCVVHVKNIGIGMTEDQIANIGFFQQFDREKYEQKGSGLGLAIASKLLELNGGTMEIQSVPNSTTVVKLFFPRKKNAA